MSMRVDRDLEIGCWPGLGGDAPARGQLRDGGGERGVAVGQATDVVAHEPHVHAPGIAHLEVGVMVGGVGRGGDLTGERRSFGERRRREPGLEALQQDSPVGELVTAGELGLRVSISHGWDRIQKESVGDLPETEAVGRGDRRGGRAVAGAEDGSDVAGADLGVARVDERAHDRAHHLVAERRGLDLEAQHPLLQVGPPGPAHPPHQRHGSVSGTALGRRQNALKSCSPISGSHARREQLEVERGRDVPGRRGQERVGHGPVQHRVAVGAAGGREPGVEVGRGGADLAHDDRGTAQLHQRALQRPAGRPWPAGRADDLTPGVHAAVGAPGAGQLDRVARHLSIASASTPATVR